MATYYTQSATVGQEVNWFYGEQTAHSHEAEIEFSKAIKTIMKLTYGNDADIDLGKIVSNASKPPTAGRRVVELKWKNGGWTNS